MWWKECVERDTRTVYGVVNIYLTTMTQHVIYRPLNLAHYYPAIHLFNLHHIAPSRHEGLLHITPLSRTVSPASSHAPRHRPGPQQLQLLPAKQRRRVHDVLHKGQFPLRPRLFSHPLTPNNHRPSPSEPLRTSRRPSKRTTTKPMSLSLPVEHPAGQVLPVRPLV